MLADTHGDGAIQFKEFDVFVRSELELDGDIPLGFKQFDGNKDGDLNLQEFVLFSEALDEVDEGYAEMGGQFTHECMGLQGSCACSYV